MNSCLPGCRQFRAIGYSRGEHHYIDIYVRLYMYYAAMYMFVCTFNLNMQCEHIFA